MAHLYNANSASKASDDSGGDEEAPPHPLDISAEAPHQPDDDTVASTPAPTRQDSEAGQEKLSQDVAIGVAEETGEESGGKPKSDDDDENQIDPNTETSPSRGLSVEEMEKLEADQKPAAVEAVASGSVSSGEAMRSSNSAHRIASDEREKARLRIARGHDDSSTVSSRPSTAKSRVTPNLGAPSEPGALRLAPNTTEVDDDVKDTEQETILDAEAVEAIAIEEDEEALRAKEKAQLERLERMEAEFRAQMEQLQNQRAIVAPEATEVTVDDDDDGKRRRNIIIAAVIGVIILIGGIVGGVVGSSGSKDRVIVIDSAATISPAPSAPPTKSLQPSMSPTTGAPSSVPTNECVEFRVDLLTDSWPNEISWTLTDNTTAIVYSESQFDENSRTVFSDCLISGREYTFSMTDTAGDGICCAYGNGFYSLFYDNVEIFRSTGEYGEGELILIPSGEMATGPPTASPTSCAFFRIVLLTDGYGAETTWTLEDSTGIVAFRGSGYSNNRRYEVLHCLNEGEQYTFYMRDSAGDGIFDPGFYELYYNGALVYNSTGDFSSLEIVDVPGGLVSTSSPTREPTPPPTPPPTLSGGSPTACVNFRLVLFTDSWSSETSWILQDSFTNIVLQGSGYADDTIYEASACLNAGAQYTFVMQDSAGDGICCSFGDGYYQLYYGDTLIHSSNGRFGSEEIIQVPGRISTSSRMLALIDLLLPGDPVPVSSPQYRALFWLADEDGRALPVADTIELRERYALTVFNFAVSEPLPGWMSIASHCSWSSVLCDGTSRVIELGLTSDNIGGNLVSELAYLKNLRELYLGSNDLTGTIPTEFMTLTNLISLQVWGNQLTGTIPPGLSNLSLLTNLGFARNLLSGTIPAADIAALTFLTSLQFFDNGLFGTIPTQLGLLTDVTDLGLSRNPLSGTIPTEIGLMTRLVNLQLWESGLTGSIPTQFGLLTRLTSMGLSNANLAGRIPSELGQCTAFTDLSVWGNSIVGSIPSSLGSLTILTNLDISSNAMTGTLPTELGLMNLYDFRAFQNDFFGTIPSEIGLLTNLSYLGLSSNRFVGTVPPALGNLALLNEAYFFDTLLTGGLETLYCGQGLSTFKADCISELVCGCCTECV